MEKSSFENQSGTTGNLSWHISDDGILTISGKGEMPNYEADEYGIYNPWDEYHNSVYSIVIYKGVSSIGDFAFSGCSNVTSVTIPDSVYDIGNSVFSGCIKLIEINVDEENQRFSSINGILFNKDKTKILRFPCQHSEIKYYIPSSVNTIGDSAFSGCTSLTSISIPNSVTDIGAYAFFGCDKLFSVTIPNSLSTLKKQTFSYCRCLTTITIPISVNKIGAWVFSGCEKLSEIINLATVPQSIDVFVFDGFDKTSCVFRVPTASVAKYRAAEGWKDFVIKTIEPIASGKTGELTWAFYPDGVLSISGTGAMPDYDWKGVTPWYTYRHSILSVLIEDKVTTIGELAFRDCRALTSVVIPNSVTNIGNAAFLDCRSLTSVTIPNSITNINDRTFCNCRCLTSVNIPNSIISIGEKAFLYCFQLTSITIPDSVTNIGIAAFDFCNRLTTIAIPNSITNISRHAFYNCNGLTKIINHATTPQIIHDTVFEGVNKNTCVLCVPTTSMEAYRTAAVWKKFKNITGIDSQDVTPIMTDKQIEKLWLNNFSNSPLVKNGVFNSGLAKKMFNGLDKEDDTPFYMGFCQFYDNFCKTDDVEKLDELLGYLNFIGITIKRQSILDAIEKGKCSYAQVLKKAFYIFKHLSNYDESLDIRNPYYNNKSDLSFFIKLERGDKQKTSFDELELPNFYNKYIDLPEGYENDTVAKRLFELIENSTNSYFLTGKAGTGKSTFIHYFTKNTQKQVLLVAFTGIAAINIGGQTIHSFFRFPLKPLLPNDPDIPVFLSSSPIRKIVKKTDTFIIDEVSMLRSDLLEGLDYSLRNNGGDPDKIFGGKQLIFVGDIFQLPPVVKFDNDVEKELFNATNQSECLYYKSEYFFDSLAYKKLKPASFEFEKIHRQQNQEFIELLNEVRDCSIDMTGIAKLNERFNPNYSPVQDEFVIMLTSNRHLAQNENINRLNNLSYNSHFFNATITGDFKEDRYPTEPILELKRNAQVMFVKNDSADNGRRWVNGTIAKVEYVDEKKIEIKLKNGSIHTLGKETWENRQYGWDENKGRITSKVIGTFEQYPVKLAWAITIHKSQGLTFDNVIVDLGSGAFVNGQLYTALSRCKTLEGLTLKRKIQQKDIIEDKRLQKFYQDLVMNSLTLEISDITDHIFNNGSFLLRLISVHYPFTVNQIKKYHSILEWGSGVPTFEADDECYQPAAMAEYGLCFNSNIDWTNEIRDLAQFEVNHYQATMWSDNIEYPLSIEDEISIRRQIKIMSCMEWLRDVKQHYNAEEIKELEEEMDKDLSKRYEVETKTFDFLSLEELVHFTNSCANIYCLNRSLYENFSKLLEQRNNDILTDILDKINPKNCTPV